MLDFFDSRPPSAPFPGQPSTQAICPTVYRASLLQILGDFLELLQGRFQIVYDFLGDLAGWREVGGIL